MSLILEFATAKEPVDRSVEPVDVDGLSGWGGGEREGRKFRVLLEGSLSAGASLTRPEWRSCAFAGNHHWDLFISAIVSLSKAHPHLPGGLASCTWIHPVVLYTENPCDDGSFVLRWGSYSMSTSWWLWKTLSHLSQTPKLTSIWIQLTVPFKHMCFLKLVNFLTVSPAVGIIYKFVLIRFALTSSPQGQPFLHSCGFLEGFFTTFCLSQTALLRFLMALLLLGGFSC